MNFSEIQYTDDFFFDCSSYHNDKYCCLLQMSLSMSSLNVLQLPKILLSLYVVGESYGEMNGYGTLGSRKKNPITKLIASEPKLRQPNIQISLPEDFRRVSAIIDVDIIPETHRRVKLMKNGSDKPLGFYIRDGTSVRVTPHGLEKVPGICISRLVPGGLAEMTGLLAVNDEVLEVNGIEVSGKTLDQVTDMMVANSSNLIITVKPVNQRNNISPKRGSHSHQSGRSMTNSMAGSMYSSQSYDSDEVQSVLEDDEDMVHDHLATTQTSASASANTVNTDTNGKSDTPPSSSPESSPPQESPLETKEDISPEDVALESTSSDPSDAKEKDSNIVTL